jgi:hypothetical protein
VPDRPRIGRDLGVDLIVGEQVLQTLGARERAAGDDGPPALGAPARQAFDEGGESPLVAAGQGEGAAELLLGLGLGVQSAGLVDALGDVEALEADRVSRGPARSLRA